MKLTRIFIIFAVMVLSSASDDDIRPRGLIAALAGFPDDYEETETDLKPKKLVSRSVDSENTGSQPKLEDKVGNAQLVPTEKADVSSFTATVTSQPEATQPNKRNIAAQQPILFNGQTVGVSRQRPAGYILWHPVPIPNQFHSLFNQPISFTSQDRTNNEHPHQPFFIPSRPNNFGTSKLISNSPPPFLMMQQGNVEKESNEDENNEKETKNSNPKSNKNKNQKINLVIKSTQQVNGFENVPPMFNFPPPPPQSFMPPIRQQFPPSLYMPFQHQLLQPNLKFQQHPQQTFQFLQQQNGHQPSPPTPQNGQQTVQQSLTQPQNQQQPHRLSTQQHTAAQHRFNMPETLPQAPQIPRLPNLQQSHSHISFNGASHPPFIPHPNFLPPPPPFVPLNSNFRSQFAKQAHQQPANQPNDVKPNMALQPQLLPTPAVQNTIPAPNIIQAPMQPFLSSTAPPHQRRIQPQHRPQSQININSELEPPKFLNSQFGLPPSKFSQSQVVITPLTTFPHVPQVSNQQQAKKLVEFDYTNGNINQPIEETYPKITSPAPPPPLVGPLAPNHFAADTFMDHPVEFPPQNDKNYASPGFHSGHRGFPAAVTAPPTIAPSVKTLRTRGKSSWKHHGSPKRSDETYYVQSKPTVYHYEIKHTS